MTIRRLMWTTLLTLSLAGTALAQGREPTRGGNLPFDDMRHWSASVSVAYEGGQWFLVDEPRAVQCHGPTAMFDGPRPSLLLFYDVQGQIIAKQTIGNPRIVLPEERKEEWRPADFVQVQLRFGLVEGAAYLELWEQPDQREPSLRVELIEAIQRAFEQPKPPCQNDNPPVVAVGDGRYVLAYVLDRAAQASKREPEELLQLMAREGRNFSGKAIANEWMPEAVIELLEEGTIRRSDGEQR